MLPGLIRSGMPQHNPSLSEDSSKSRNMASLFFSCLGHPLASLTASLEYLSSILKARHFPLLASSHILYNCCIESGAGGQRRNTETV